MLDETKSSKTALITGTSSGIGLATAIAFARAGFRVVATMRQIERGDRLRAAAAKARANLDILTLDVTDEASVKSGVSKAAERAGGIDVLVNNAGVGLLGALEETTL